MTTQDARCEMSMILSHQCDYSPPDIYRIVSATMEALPPLHEVGQVFSCCELCVENKRCHLIILVVTFVLMTFDMITDWINWIEWYGIGGYDQYFFASMFETVFL